MIKYKKILITIFLVLFQTTIRAESLDEVDLIETNEQNQILNYNISEEIYQVNYINKKLSLIDILDIAMKNNPQIKQAWLNIDVGKYSYYSELSELLPDLTANVSYSRNKTKLDEQNAVSVRSKSLTPSVGMSYLLFNFGGRTADILRFKYKLNAIKYDKELFVQEFIYNVIKNYYNLFSSIENLNASKDIESSSLKAYESASLRYDIGLAPLTDKLQAETSYTQAKLSREKAENIVKVNRANLNYLLNISPLFELDLEIPNLDINKDEFKTNIADLINLAITNSPKLKSYYENRKAKRAELYSNIVSWLPSVRLTGSYSIDKDLENKNNPNRKNYNIGVTASMPFFTGGRIYSNSVRVKKELDIVNQQIIDKEKEIELDVWTAYQNFITARQTYLTALTLHTSAQETEKTILGKYKNGKSSILDLLNAQSNLASAKYEKITAQHNWFITRANLLRSIGLMSIEEVNNLANSAKINLTNRE